MLARRSRVNQLRMLPHQLLQCCFVAADDRVGRRLEGGGFRLMGQAIEVRGEAGPARKTVRAREHELGIGQHAATFVAVQCSRGELLDLLPRALDLLPLCAREERCHPAVGPCGDRTRIGFAGFDQILGELAVLLDAGTGRKRQCILRIGKHTKLLSVLARRPRCSG